MAPRLALLAMIALVAVVIAAPRLGPLLVVGVVAVAALTNQVWLSYKVAELAGTGFCAVCTRRESPWTLER